MLELRPNCEWCDADLPPDAVNARICSYECTYCANCVDDILHGVCPTCGGNFAPRPIRPRRAYRDSPRLGLDNQPASVVRKHSRWDATEVERFIDDLKNVAPEDR